MGTKRLGMREREESMNLTRENRIKKARLALICADVRYVISLSLSLFFCFFGEDEAKKLSTYTQTKLLLLLYSTIIV